MEILLSLFTGFSASSSLIVGIGAQNTFVLQQGLRRQHLLATALTCSSIDALLITGGVLGLGQYISEQKMLLEIMKYFAVLFLVGYGLFSFRSAYYRNGSEASSAEHPGVPVQKVVLSLLALTLLNPHVYLDTVVLLGSIASQQPVHTQSYFAVGAVAASFAWFFSITFAARFLEPFFKKEYSWKFVDVLTGLIMWGIAWTVFHAA